MPMIESQRESVLRGTGLLVSLRGTVPPCHREAGVIQPKQSHDGVGDCHVPLKSGLAMTNERNPNDSWRGREWCLARAEINTKSKAINPK